MEQELGPYKSRPGSSQEAQEVTPAFKASVLKFGKMAIQKVAKITGLFVRN